MQPLLRFSVRTVLVASTLALAAGTLVSCGDYLKPQDPATNTRLAQTQVDHFVEFYNRDGMEIAVELNFCPDDQGPYLEKASLDGSPWVADSMFVSTPVTIDGDAGRGEISVSATSGSARTYPVKLRRDRVQGWCITAVAD